MIQFTDAELFSIRLALEFAEETEVTVKIINKIKVHLSNLGGHEDKDSWVTQYALRYRSQQNK